MSFVWEEHIFHGNTAFLQMLDDLFSFNDGRVESEFMADSPSGVTFVPALSEGHHNILAAKRSRTPKQPKNRGPNSLD